MLVRRALNNNNDAKEPHKSTATNYVQSEVDFVCSISGSRATSNGEICLSFAEPSLIYNVTKLLYFRHRNGVTSAYMCPSGCISHRKSEANFPASLNRGSLEYHV